MIIAIISDIHSNFEALTAAMNAIDRLGVDEIVCLGDVVGYGADPNACIDLVRRRCSIVLKGNHEAAVGNATETDRFNVNARSAIVWTRRQLTPENLAYIASLPLTASRDSLFLVHATPCNPESWKYIFDPGEALPAFGCFEEPVCCIGHTHVPAIFTPAGSTRTVARTGKYLINVGSVGQPRDRNTKLSFGVFDTGQWKYDNVRCPYDVETAAWKILKTDLPSRLGHRLLMGV